MNENVRILVVDDDPLLLRLTSRVLRSVGYEVLEAFTGMDGLRLAKETNPDLILLDVVLPDIDGIEVCRRIRADPETAGIYLIMLSGILITSDSQAEGLETGADEYIARPLSNRELLARVRTVVRLQQAEKALQAAHDQLEVKVAQRTAALEEASRRFRIVSELISDYAYAFRVDPDGTRVREWVTDAFAEITGFTPEELDARGGWTALIPAQDMPIAQRRTQRLYAGQADVSEFRIVTKHGDIRWLRDYGRPEWSEDGKQVIGIVGAAQDITDRARAEAALRRSLDETAHSQCLLLALSQAAQAVQRARTPEQICRTVGEETSKLGYQATIFELNDDRTRLVAAHMTFQTATLRAAERLTGLSGRGYSFPLAPGGFYQRLLTGGKAVFSDPGVEPIAETLPRGVRPLADHLDTVLGLSQAIYAPLTIGGKTFGVLTVLGSDLTKADVPAISALANQMSIALENGQLLNEVETQRSELRQLWAQLLRAQEKEREHISRELHDELGQALTAISINLAEIESELSSEPRLVALERARETRELADQTLDQVREMSLNLRPSMLDDLGLVPTLSWYVNRFARRLNIEAQFKAAGLDELLDSEVETVLYRVVQEALTNVARHAQASQVWVKLARAGSAIVATIQDDGQGFDARQLADRDFETHGAGLLGIRERVAYLEGRFDIQSQPEKGTILSIEIPV
jgi:two-component system sensor histidine kinase UhpB